MFKDNFIQISRSHHLSLSSERTYWSAVVKYIRWLGVKSVKELENNPTDNFRRYLSFLANQHPDREEGDEGVSASSQNLAFHALRFLYEKVVGVPLGDLSGIPKSVAHQKIVDVPPDDIARRIVDAIPGRTGLALRLIYGTASRLNDVLRIRVKELDFRKKLVAIQQSKGGKSRLVPMPESLRPELADLVREREKIHEDDLRNGFGWVHMPGNLAIKYPSEQTSLGWQYVFYADDLSTDPRTGNKGRHHLLDTSLQRAFLSARRRLKIRRHYTIHSLRHAGAQFWERHNVPVSDIQKLLGHADVDTTMRYLQSGQRGVPKVPSPI